MTARQPPPMHYDGQLFWYTEWFDPTDDRCCICRELIPEDEIPLILFKKVGKETWQTRVHVDPCALPFIARGHLSNRKKP